MTKDDDSTQARKPIRAVVLQFARLGDTIQSLMALRAAQQLYPELEVTFVVHENFAEAAQRTPWVKKVITFPTTELLSPILSGERNSIAQLPELAGWIEPLIEQPWDLVVNWTFSDASSYLAAILPATTKIGYVRKPDGGFHLTDGWSHYVQGIVQSDVEQGIHLTDILTTQLLTALQLNFGEGADAGSSSVTSKNFFGIDRDQKVCEGWTAFGNRWIALQLGASHSRDLWEPSQWAKLASLILRRHDDYRIILLGNERERGLEKAFFDAFYAEVDDPGKFEGRIVSKVGETSFELWIRVLSDAQWVFSAGNAAVHAASVLGTRVLQISAGAGPTSRFQETGPYGNGHYLARNATAEGAYAAFTYAITEWQHRRELPIEDHLQRLEVAGLLRTPHEKTGRPLEIYRSKIRSSDQGGGVYYEPLIQRPVELSAWYSQVLAYLAREWYCGWVPKVGSELSRNELHPDLVSTLRKLQEGLVVLDQILGESIRTADHLHQKTKQLRSETLMKMSDKASIQELGSKLEELEALVERIGSAQAPLSVFHRMLRVLMHNIRGEKLSELARETSDTYRFLRLGVGSMREWVDHTLKLARPMAIPMVAPVIPLSARSLR